MSTLQKAIEIAVKAHSDQKRKNGDPYILHPIRVLLKMETEEEKIIAILHDVVEDTVITEKDLIAAGFSDKVICMLQVLTHAKEESYDKYIDRILYYPTARKVKMADLQDNMNLDELPEITDYDIRRTQKYIKALALIKKAEREKK